jgi:ethanolamine utilization cobalamin adenosyltransferase
MSKTMNDLERLRSEVRERQEILVESLKKRIDYELRRDDRLDGLN